MSDLELRIYAMNVARESEGAKATTDELLRAADELFWWLKTGAYGDDVAPKPN